MKRAKRPVKRRRAANVKRQVIEEREFNHQELVQEHVAEIEYRPAKTKRTYRLIALRKRLKITKGQLRLDDEIRYFFYITNLPASQMSPAEAVRENNKRCNQENLIEQLKNGVQATRMPVREFNANWAYLVIGSLAWNIKSWAGMLLPKALGAAQLVTMEFRRFLDEIILVPSQIIKGARRLTFRLLEVNRWTMLLIEGTQRLRKRRSA